MSSRKKLIIICVSLCLVILIIVLLFGKKKSTLDREKELTNITFDDVSFINIRYNNARDVIVVTKDQDYNVEYSGFNEEGYDILDDAGNKKVNKTKLSKDVKDYIIKEVLPNLKEYKEGSTDWYISMNVNNLTKTTLRGKKGTEPKWFLKLLEKLEIEKYGNISLKKQK